MERKLKEQLIENTRLINSNNALRSEREAEIRKFMVDKNEKHQKEISKLKEDQEISVQKLENRVMEELKANYEAILKEMNDNHEGEIVTIKVQMEEQCHQQIEKKNK